MEAYWLRDKCPQLTSANSAQVPERNPEAADVTAATYHHNAHVSSALDGSDDLVTPAVLGLVAEQSASLIDREQRVVRSDFAADFDVWEALGK
jgi:hypothetical protein